MNKIEEYESIENIDKNKMNEGNWIPVLEFPEYMVSDQGHIKETKSGKILKEYLDDEGYLRVWMTMDGNKNLVLIHPIVYYSFRPEEIYSMIEHRLEEEILEEIDEEELLNNIDDSIVN